MPQPTPAPIARAIDLGYGHVKFSTAHASTHEGKLKLPCASFPSLPVPSPAAASECTDGAEEAAQGLPIEVDGQHYRISQTPEQIALPSHVRGGGDSYIGSNFYRVCMAAAVKMMRLQVPCIAHLVLGTPVSNFEAGKKAIVEHFSRGVTFDGKTVQIDHIHVLRQPLGGLIYHYRRSGREGDVARFNRLIVDPGYGTLDWVVARGLHVNAPRSGSTAPNPWTSARRYPAHPRHSP